jgi:hypothetical protein
MGLHWPANIICLYRLRAVCIIMLLPILFHRIESALIDSFGSCHQWFTGAKISHLETPIDPVTSMLFNAAITLKI